MLCGDEKLASIIQELPEPYIQSSGNVFHDLMSCVLEQQIHYRSTKKVFEKMLQSAGITLLSPDNSETFEEKAFDKAKLSQSKYETVLEVLDLLDKNKPDWQNLNDAEVRARLSTIKGIGSWTIDMILLYTLQRPDIFPADDFHLKQIMTTLYELDPKQKLKAHMKAIAEGWGAHKSLAVLYLLAWKESQKNKP